MCSLAAYASEILKNDVYKIHLQADSVRIRNIISLKASIVLPYGISMFTFKERIYNNLPAIVL